MFELLRAIDRRDGDWFGRQPAEAQKTFAPPVAQRFAVTVADGAEAAYMLWMVNERVNRRLYDLYKHPELTYRLLASCGLGVLQKHQWLAGATRRHAGNIAVDLLASQHPEANDDEIAFLLSQYDRDGFGQYLDECGIQPAEAKQLIKAYDQLSR